MPSISNPEKRVVASLLEHLRQVSANVHLGYSATGLEKDLELPAILVQLLSISEEGRQGAKAKYRLEFNISAVVKTNTETTYALMDFTRSVRELFSTNERFTPEASDFTADNISLALRAAVTAASMVAVVDEDQYSYSSVADELIPFSKLPDLTKALTVKNSNDTVLADGDDDTLDLRRNQGSRRWWY